MELDSVRAVYVDNPNYAHEMAARYLWMREMQVKRVEARSAEEPHGSDTTRSDTRSRAEQEAAAIQKRYLDKLRKLEGREADLDKKLRELHECLNDIRNAQVLQHQQAAELIATEAPLPSGSAGNRERTQPIQRMPSPKTKPRVRAEQWVMSEVSTPRPKPLTLSISNLQRLPKVEE